MLCLYYRLDVVTAMRDLQGNGESGRGRGRQMPANTESQDYTYFTTSSLWNEHLFLLSGCRTQIGFDVRKEKDAQTAP